MANYLIKFLVDEVDVVNEVFTRWHLVHISSLPCLVAEKKRAGCCHQPAVPEPLKGIKKTGAGKEQNYSSDTLTVVSL
jgi:hypothetical protein